MKTSLVVVALLVSCLVAQAQDAPPVRSYPVADHGALNLSVPAKWTERVRSAQGVPPTIELSSDDGKALLLVTPLWSPDDDPKFNSTENIHTAIERAAKAVEGTAVEEKLTLRPLETSSGEGHFFWATDRAPKAGEYKYMANGAVPAGKLLLSFTVLSHVAPPEGLAEAIAVVASAAHKP